MSWFSEFLHSPIGYIKEQPLKALSLLAAPAAAIAAPFAFPAIGSALGIGAGAGAGTAAGEGLLGGLGGLFGGGEGGGLASLFGAGEGGGLSGLFGGAEAGGLGAGVAGGGEYGGIASALGLEGFSPEAFTAFASEGAGTPFEGNLEWISRLFPGQFEGSTGVLPGLGEGAGGGINLGGIITDPAMSGAPLAGSEAAAAAEPGFWSKLGTGALSSLTKNPLGIALAGGGLGYNILQGNKESPEMKAMAANATALNAQGQQLMQYLQSGTLPPGLQQAVTNATQAMKARIVANHARNGMATDPSQNSALAQELNNVDLQAIALIAQQGQQLLNSGMNATNMSNQLYGILENLNRQQSQQMGQAIANFAAALSGPRVSLNLGGRR